MGIWNGPLRTGCVALVCFFCSVSWTVGQDTRSATDVVGRLPLGFVPNVGQAPEAVVFEARGLRGTLGFQTGGVGLTLPTELIDPSVKGLQATQTTASVYLRFVGATSRAPESLGAPQGKANFFLGRDRAHWRSGIPISTGVAYRGVYPGIDLHYNGVDGRLKGTWYVSKGVNPSSISWRYDGPKSCRLSQAGDLILTLDAKAGKEIIEEAPVAWQVVSEGSTRRRTPVDVSFVLRDNGTIGFECGAYDPSLPLVIDPFIDYSTVLGGNGTDNGSAVVIDSQGRCVITGRTHSTTLGGGPTWPLQNPLMNYGGEIADVFLTRLSQDGSQLEFSTYIGGGDPFDLTVNGGSDWGIDLALESDGSIWIVGMTESQNFPITPNALQPTHGGGGIDGFLLKVNAAGDNLDFSSYIGGVGLDYAFSVAIGDQDAVHVVGTTGSYDFPVTPGAYRETFDGVTDGFLTVLDFNGAVSAYSTFVGFEGEDKALGVAVDSFGQVFVVGATDSVTDALTVLPFGTVPVQPLNAGGIDAFLAVIDPVGAGAQDLRYFTYHGGVFNDAAWDVELNDEGIPHFVGLTNSNDFPVLHNQISYAGGLDGFMVRLEPDGFGAGDLHYSILMGGLMDDCAFAVSILNDAAYVTGLFHSFVSQDAFIVKVDSQGHLIDGAIFGGSALDVGLGIVATLQGIYVIGQTECDQPTQANAHHIGCQHSFPSVGAPQSTFGGGWTDAFVTRFTLF